MNVQKILLAIALVVLLCLVPATVHAQVTADDFLPPVTGGPTDVKQPDKVAMKGDTVTAATAQDAINVAAKENVKELNRDLDAIIEARVVAGGMSLENSANVRGVQQRIRRSHAVSVRDRARLEDPEHRDYRSQGFVEQDAHPIAWPDTGIGQRQGQLAAHGVERPVVHGLVLHGERFTVRISGRALRKEMLQ